MPGFNTDLADVTTLTTYTATASNESSTTSMTPLPTTTDEPGLSESDKIALGVGLSVPTAALVVGVLALVQQWRSERRSPKEAIAALGRAMIPRRVQTAPLPPLRSRTRAERRESFTGNLQLLETDPMINWPPSDEQGSQQDSSGHSGAYGYDDAADEHHNSGQS